ncbi:hypothetical protein LEMLEM_LOCUS4597, partial [Lemmus lemmus]
KIFQRGFIFELNQNNYGPQLYNLWSPPPKTPPILGLGCTDCAEKLTRHRKHCEMVHQDCVLVKADEQLQNRKELFFIRLRKSVKT